MSESFLDQALREQWCNGCKQPRRHWGPICGGMTQGDYTHYHSPEWWRARLGGTPSPLGTNGYPMSPPVSHCLHPENPSRPSVTAGADEPEGVAVERVATHPAADDASLTASDRDRVEHHKTLSATPRLPASSLAERDPREAVVERDPESDRLARLRRWQAVGERRT